MKYSVRFYKPDDFDAVIELLAENKMDTNHDAYSFGSKALVVEDKDKVIGFTWVIAGDSKTVYLYDFVVSKKYRSKKDPPGLFLAKALFGLLDNIGYENYLCDVQPHRKNMYKILTKQLKGKDCGEHSVMRGNIKVVNESLLSF